MTGTVTLATDTKKDGCLNGTLMRLLRQGSRYDQKPKIIVFPK